MSDSPRTVVFCQASMGLSGSEISLRELISFAAPVADVVVLAGEDGPTAEWLRARGYKVEVARVGRLRRSIATLPRFIVGFVTVWTALRRILKSRPTACVYVNSLMFPQAAVAARLCGARCVVHIREIRETFGAVAYDLHAVVAWMTASQLISAASFVLHQPGVSRFCFREGVVVPNSCDVMPLATAREVGPIRVVAVIPLTRRKGLLELLAAMKALASRDGRRIALSVIGRADEPAMKQALDSTAMCLGRGGRVTVEYLGEMADVSSEYARADLLVHPSWFETLPRVLVEASAAALPVVATDVGGVREVVLDNVTGILVPPRNAVALADAIETLVESEALRTAFGSAGFERFKVQFSRSAVGKRWTDTCLGNES